MKKSELIECLNTIAGDPDIIYTDGADDWEINEVIIDKDRVVLMDEVLFEGLKEFGCFAEE